MTLSRKILLCDVALMCGLLALGVVSLCGLRALQRHQDTTTNEYAELRRVEATNVHLASALAMMQASTPDPARATSELRAALEQVQQLQVLQEEGPASSVGHEKAEAQTIQRTLTRLHQVIDDLANAPTAA